MAFELFPTAFREFNPLLTIIVVHHVRKDRFESPRNLLADARLWIESVSGHYALASHVDACFGLERQRDNDGEEWIAFGGIARNTEPRTMLLEDDEVYTSVSKYAKVRLSWKQIPNAERTRNLESGGEAEAGIWLQ